MVFISVYHTLDIDGLKSVLLDESVEHSMVLDPVLLSSTSSKGSRNSGYLSAYKGSNPLQVCGSVGFIFPFLDLLTFVLEKKCRNIVTQNGLICW